MQDKKFGGLYMRRVMADVATRHFNVFIGMLKFDANVDPRSLLVALTESALKLTEGNTILAAEKIAERVTEVYKPAGLFVHVCTRHDVATEIRGEVMIDWDVKLECYRIVDSLRAENRDA